MGDGEPFAALAGLGGWWKPLRRWFLNRVLRERQPVGRGSDELESVWGSEQAGRSVPVCPQLYASSSQQRLCSAQVGPITLGLSIVFFVLFFNNRQIYGAIVKLMR